METEEGDRGITPINQELLRNTEGKGREVFHFRGVDRSLFTKIRLCENSKYYFPTMNKVPVCSFWFTQKYQKV